MNKHSLHETKKFIVLHNVSLCICFLFKLYGDGNNELPIYVLFYIDCKKV